MSSPLGIAAKCVTAVLDFFQVIDSINYLNESTYTDLATANLANRLALLGFTTIEIKKLVINSDDSLALSNLKSSELPFRCCNLVLQIFKAFDSEETGMPLLEQAVIAPLADIIRVASEQSAYEVKHVLDTCSEELSTPVKNEQLQKLQALESRIRKAFYTRIGAETSLISWGMDVMVQNYLDYLRVHQNYEQEDPREILSLLHLSIIPPFLHNDEVLKKYICSITLQPIRDPVQDPTTELCENPTLYEKSAITRWLEIRGKSPVTQKELTLDRLIPKPDIKCIIDLRLQFHQTNMDTYLAESTTLTQNLARSNTTV
ncbi:MAG: U-box domain-containing protein [Candidatus Rhabdochlamydia sp.]